MCSSQVFVVGKGFVLFFMFIIICIRPVYLVMLTIPHKIMTKTLRCFHKVTAITAAVQYDTCGQFVH